MRFVISSEVMSADEPTQNGLDQIVVRAEQRIHEAAIPDADLLPETEWYRSCRPTRRKFLEEVARRAAYGYAPTGPHSKAFDVRTPDDVAVASRLANAPLLVVVENSTSDKALLEVAIRAFGSGEAQELCFGYGRSVDPPAFDVRQAGGNGEVMKIVRAEIEDAMQRGRMARVIVVTDSDGEFKGDVHKDAAAIQAECAQLNVPCHMLEKRTAENYLPDEVWEEWAGTNTQNRAIVTLLKTMSPEQRDHVRLAQKKTAPWDSNVAGAQSLFGSVSAGDKKLLEEANLKGSGRNMTILRLTGTTTAGASRDALARRDHSDDLPRLVQMIEDEF